MFEGFSHCKVIDSLPKDLPYRLIVFIINNFKHIICLDSDVYMDDKTETNEYVLEETGCLFTGSPLFPNKKEWYFGQVRF